MKLLLAALAVAALVTAAPAAADTNSIADVGNGQAGFSIGTTGGTLSAGGYKTTVDGFGTLHGTTTVVGPGVNAGIVQSYDQGFESTTHVNGFSNGTEIYYDGTSEFTYTTPNGSVELVCTPTTGCTQG